MIGTRIGNYLIQEKLGEGGMGVVYKGLDLNLDRPVAIKSLAPDLSQSSECIERFRHEAIALAKLDHVNIATVYNLEQSNRQYFMIMEYLEGDTFDRLIRARGRIPCLEATCWFKQALLGMGYAHAHSIVHRDIKPGNLMLTRCGIVKVMDFGIAKVLGAQRLTRASAQLGTLAYMSPEQIRNGPIDQRTDIYSLSVTLFEMLTGRLPFTGSSDFALMSAHLETPPPPLSRFCPELAGPLEQALLRGLAKNPAARFQTAEEFGAALDRVEVQAHSLPPRSAPRPSPDPRPAPVSPPVRFLQSPPRVPSPPPGVYRRPTPTSAPGGFTTSWRRARYRGFLSLSIGAVMLALLAYEGLRLENIGLLVACAVLLYFFPILIAAISLKRNGPTVVRLNALRGWTGIGWVEAMKHALADDSEP